jgi:Flp pilus assembly protein TadG
MGGHGRRSRPARNESGASLVEAAIILPVVLLIVFGIIEFGLAFKNALTVNSGTRAGVRTASAEPRRPSFHADTAAAVQKAITALPSGSVQELWIYKADADGDPDGGGSAYTSCNTCSVWTWNTATNSFERQPGKDWAPASQNACVGDPNHDAVGVYLKVNHDFVTGFFGSRIALTDHVVMRLEPVPATGTGCAPAA